MASAIIRWHKPGALFREQCGLQFLTKVKGFLFGIERE